MRSDYVEQPNDEKLIEAAINGMLTSLDPHSSYMNAKSFQEMQVQTQGKFGGLGIEVTMENGVVKVVSPIDDTPAAKAGVMANDLIVKLDGEDVQGMTLNEAVDKMRGKINTPITLTIVRDGKDPFDVKLVRDEIRVKSVKISIEGQDKDIGYIAEHLTALLDLKEVRVVGSRRQRSSTHSIRCGIAAPISSPAGSGRRTATLPPTAWRKHSVCRSTAIRARSLSCTNRKTTGAEIS